MQLPIVPPDAQLSFECKLETRWSDEDNQCVLNNAVYLTLFEEARHRFFTERGCLPEGRFPFLLAQTHLRFVAPGRGGVPVQVRLGTTRLGNSSFEQAYRVSGPDGETWCEGEALLVCYDPETGAAKPMEDAFRKSIQGS